MPLLILCDKAGLPGSHALHRRQQTLVERNALTVLGTCEHQALNPAETSLQNSLMVIPCKD